MRSGRLATAFGALALAGSAYAVTRTVSEPVPTPPAGRRPTPPERVEFSEQARNDALRRATVWSSTPLDDPSEHDAETASSAAFFECRFAFEVPGGTTPKFECETAEGRIVKVKYAGAEPHGEAAATALLRAVGFPADRVTFVERVRCYGCPPLPFYTSKALGLINALHVLRPYFSAYREFEWAAVERKHRGTAIETGHMKGWAWHELDRLREPSAQTDALKLLAVFLAHWDNKPENQRLVCLDTDGETLARGRCVSPAALLQDLGATFGPRKVSLKRWHAMPVWKDRERCLVSMEDLPHDGATFQPSRISEAGRRFLSERLGALSRTQIRAIFERARFPEHDGLPIERWVEAFEHRRAQVTDGPPCPPR